MEASSQITNLFMTQLSQGNCPFCDAERGAPTAWGMSPEGMQSLKKQHDMAHPNYQPEAKPKDLTELLKLSAKELEKALLPVIHAANEDQKKLVDSAQQQESLCEHYFRYKYKGKCEKCYAKQQREESVEPENNLAEKLLCKTGLFCGNNAECQEPEQEAGWRESFVYRNHWLICDCDLDKTDCRMEKLLPAIEELLEQERKKWAIEAEIAKGGMVSTCLSAMGVDEWAMHGKKYGYWDYFMEVEKKKWVAEVMGKMGFHYWRECDNCGYAGNNYLHCAHDQRQSHCVKCEKELGFYLDGECECDFVMTEEELLAILEPKPKDL